MKEWESKMLEEKLFEIFKRMSATEYISAERLAKAVGVSEKTIRTRLCMLDDWLQQNQAALISKPRYGYRIITEHYDELYHRLLQEQEGSQGISDNLQERVQYVLLYLLCQANYVKSEDLIDFLYISKGTLSGVLKQVEQILNNYRLRLDRRPNYGIKIIGREFDIRNCMLEYFVKRSLIDIEQEKQKADIEKIATLATTVLKDYYKTAISEEETGYLALIFLLGLERKQNEEKQKLNILIVCVSGKGSSQLLKYKYMHRFHDYIQEVYTCDMLELKEFDLEKINFVFTTVPIPWEISKSVVEIGLFLSVRRGTVPDLP